MPHAILQRQRCIGAGRARGICALPYTRLRDGAQSYIPVNIIGNLYVSNGMAAGNTLREARTQALSEIFERHIKYRIIGEALCLPEVPDEVVARFPNIQAGIAGLRKAGFGILVKDASLGGRYPVMNVTLVHPRDQGVFSSYGAHPRFEIALERAMTELLQGRRLNALEGFPEPGFDMGEINSVANLEWENNSLGNSIRPSLLRLSDLSEDEAGELLSELQTMNLNDERPLWEILGLAIPPGTPWQQLRIGELKTLLALAVGDEETIREGCEWIRYFNDLDPARRRVYRCMECLLNLDDRDDYRRSLTLLYGDETVRLAEALLDRRERFFGLDALGADLQGSPMHQTLLNAYDKLFAGDR